jgi:5'-nucleotidase
MPRILITNDDGIHSQGIRKLEEALRAIGEVIVVAPSHEMSAASHALTLGRPLRIDRIDEYHFAVDGTPVDCVTLAMGEILREAPPDIIVSGINHGGNLGDDVLYSGTVAGAMEALVYSLPGVAISQVGRGEVDFEPAAHFAAILVRRILAEGLPERTVLNVNIPRGPIRGVRLTHQGTRVARIRIHPGVDPRGRRYYWIGEEHAEWNHEEMSDYEAVREGYISITPLHNNLTNFRALEQLHTWAALADDVALPEPKW